MNDVTQENAYELLARYMEGECTQEELRQLKEYFRSTPDLPADLAPYARMFDIIDEKQPTPSVEALDRFAAPSPLPLLGSASSLLPFRSWHSSKGEARRGFFLLVAACIAAFAFILLTPSQKEESLAIAYIDGKMITDETLAMQMGKEVLGEIFSNGNEEQQLNELFNAP